MKTDFGGRKTSLCYLEKDGRYLILHRTKKEHDENQDKWIGVGGKFEPGETPDVCALREVKEETGLTMTDYRLRGVIAFISDRWQTEYMFLYTANGFEGEVGSCNEGDLEWIDKRKVYDLPVWEGDKIFFRLLETRADCFSLKLRYVGESLVEVLLDGRAVDWQAMISAID